VKSCGYCGRQNDDGASACAECGTTFEATPTAPPKPKPPRRWPNLGLRYAAYAVGVALFYFMSLGPVMYCFTKVTTTTTVAGPAVTTSMTVEVPGWIGVVYSPAFALYNTQAGDSPYSAHLHWWMERQQAKK
jgi:hypothetical protein